jgi:hypothetical protein
MAVEVKEVLIDISSDDDLSNAISIAEDEIVGLEIPTLTSANVTFQVASKDSGPYVPLFKSDGSAAYTITAATGNLIVWVPELAPVEFVKVATSAGQAADRTFKFLLKKK